MSLTILNLLGCRMISVILLSLTSFGVHYTRSFLTIFSVYLIEEDYLSPAGYGALLSLMAFASVFVPLYFGYLASKTANPYLIMLVLLLAILGSQIVFIASIASRSFMLEIISWGIFGLCASSISSTQRAITSQCFVNDQGMGTGIYISLANASKVLGKLSVTPIMVSKNVFGINMQTFVYVISLQTATQSCTQASIAPALASLTSLMAFWASSKLLPSVPISVMNPSYSPIPNELDNPSDLEGESKIESTVRMRRYQTHHSSLKALICMHSDIQIQELVDGRYRAGALPAAILRVFHALHSPRLLSLCVPHPHQLYSSLRRCEVALDDPGVQLRCCAAIPCGNKHTNPSPP